MTNFTPLTTQTLLQSAEPLTLKEAQQRSEPVQFMPRVECLDGLRGLAAICVALVFHYRHFYNFGTDPNPWFFENFLIRPVVANGNLSVDLFFGISGFIMTMAYFATIHDGTVSGRKFTVLRFSRLWPLHASTTIAAGVLGYGYFLTTGRFLVAGVDGNDTYHLLLQMLMMQSVGLRFAHSFDFVSWSLSIEVACYVVFFLICRGGKYFDLWSGFLFLIGTYLLFNRIDIIFLSVDTGRGLVGFFSGCLICRAVQAGYTRPLAIAAWSFLVFYAVTAMLPVPPGSIMANPRVGVPLTWQTVILPSVLVVTLTCPPLRYIFSSKPFAWGGRLSYSIYLNHFLIQYCIFLGCHALGRSVPYDRFRFYAMYVTAVLGLSLITYFLIERPAQAWLRSKWDANGALRHVARVDIR